MGQLMLALRVLVVDDNVDAAELIAIFLSMHGHEVKVANDGKQAVALAQQFAPDIIFLDIGMPGMDGYEVAATLRDTPSFSSTRIVALTAWGDPSARARAVACGFNAHLVKPATLNSILSETFFVKSNN